MGAREEHIELVKRGMELLERRSYDEFRPYLTEDVVWYGAFQPEVESVDFFADEDQVVSHEHLRLTRNGRTVETEAVHVTELRDPADPQALATLMA